MVGLTFNEQNDTHVYETVKMIVSGAENIINEQFLYSLKNDMVLCQMTETLQSYFDEMVNKYADECIYYIRRHNNYGEYIEVSIDIGDDEHINIKSKIPGAVLTTPFEMFSYSDYIDDGKKNELMIIKED